MAGAGCTIVPADRPTHAPAPDARLPGFLTEAVVAAAEAEPEKFGDLPERMAVEVARRAAARRARRGWE